MSDIAHEQASSELQNSLIGNFAEAASAVLSQVAGTALQVQPGALDTAVEAATLVRIEITGALQGLCEIALSAPMSARFAALLTGETPEPTAEFSSDTREAAVELIQQICGNAADRLRRTFGPLELKPHLAERSPEYDPTTGTRQLCLVPCENGALDFELHILRLVAEQKPVAEPAASTHSMATELATQPQNVTAADSLPSQSGNRNLDLLLDIELGVTLRFGRRQMPLQDIIELCSGSVVELDRRVEEPVDLLIDGRLIAQGEVVIVEGNYGLRVTQVAAQSEKIACLP